MHYRNVDAKMSFEDDFLIIIRELESSLIIILLHFFVPSSEHML